MSNQRDVANNKFADVKKYRRLSDLQLRGLLEKHIAAGTLTPALDYTCDLQSWMERFCSSIDAVYRDAEGSTMYRRISMGPSAEERHERLLAIIESLDRTLELFTGKRTGEAPSILDMPDSVSYFISQSKKNELACLDIPNKPNSSILRALNLIKQTVTEASRLAAFVADQDLMVQAEPALEQFNSTRRKDDVFGDALLRGLLKVWKDMTGAEADPQYDSDSNAKVGFATFFEAYFREVGEELTAEAIVRRCKRLQSETK